jgi:leucine-zipper-like transcriptional regulator 1
LEVLTPLPNHDFGVEDRSTSMGGTALPPGLRFPTGAILGHHLVIAGTYLAHSYQSFSIWALDLVNMTWSRIDPGATLSTGSWSRGVLWENANRFLIFGNREGNLVEDYNRRLLSWDHVAYIDLEAFGIYQPPELALNLAAQELGLAALEEGAVADFELICDDGRRIGCSRRMLENRWPWFKEQRKEFVNSVSKAMEGMPKGGKARGDVAMPELPGVLSDVDKESGRPDPRLTPRTFQLSEPYPVTLAFLQWIYAQALITRLQHAPPVLSALLLLATTYKLDLLEKQVRHAMHGALNAATSVGVYEVATLCDCQSLQIRALKVVMVRPSYTHTRWILI